MLQTNENISNKFLVRFTMTGPFGQFEGFTGDWGDTPKITMMTAPEAYQMVSEINNTPFSRQPENVKMLGAYFIRAQLYLMSDRYMKEHFGGTKNSARKAAYKQLTEWIGISAKVVRVQSMLDYMDSQERHESAVKSMQSMSESIEHHDKSEQITSVITWSAVLFVFALIMLIVLT